MKKLTILIIFCLLFTPCMYAQESDIEYSQNEDEDIDEGSKWRQSRGIEIGLMYINDIYYAGNFIVLNKIMRDTIKINLDDIPKSLKMNIGIDIIPIYFSFDSKEGWGVGLTTQFQTTGFVGVNSDLPIITDAYNKKSDLGLAAFYNIEPNGFFHINGLKITVRPTLFFPIAYVKSKINYTLDASQPYAVFNYDITLYTAFNTENYNGLSFSSGLDLSLSAEYPLSKELGITNPLLDFDLGTSLIGIPIVPGKLRNYNRAWGKYEIYRDDEGEIKTKSDDDSYNGKGSVKIIRPFVFHLWTNWRPLGNELLTITPLIGLQVNQLYLKPVSLEAGITGHLNIFNIFHTKLGINYHDRMWINSVDFILYSRAIELNIGYNLRSQSFVESWNGSGYGFRFGIKFGW